MKPNSMLHLQNPTYSHYFKNSQPHRVRPASPGSYLTVTPLTKSSPWPLANGKTERTHYYEIIWCISGSGTFQTDAKIFSLQPNTAYCLTPGQTRKFYEDLSFEGYYISFSDDLLTLSGCNISKIVMFNSRIIVSRPIVISLDENSCRSIISVVQRMDAEMKNGDDRLCQELLSGLLYIFLVDLTRSVSNSEIQVKSSRDTELVSRFLHHLRLSYKKFKMVNDYAEHLNITPYRLNRAVKVITGFTAIQVIHQQIVMEAKRQVIHQRSTMKEVAYDLGFDNLAHFSKFFKHNSGVTFSEFSKQTSQL